MQPPRWSVLLSNGICHVAEFKLFLQEFLAKCPAPKGSQETSLAKGILPATSYLSLPSKLPELKHKEGYQVNLDSQHAHHM